MDQCRGTFGRLFGHDYESYLTYCGIPKEIHIKSEGMPLTPYQLKEFKVKKYAIRCTRCGKVLEDDN